MGKNPKIERTLSVLYNLPKEEEEIEPIHPSEVVNMIF